MSSLDFIRPPGGELEGLRADPLLWEQELDVRPDVAADLERAIGMRAGQVFWRSSHDHLYSLELADLGRGRPSMVRIFGWWYRYEPRPPEHEIDSDLVDLCLWAAGVASSLDVDVVSKVLRYHGASGGWPEGSVLRTPAERLVGLPDFDFEPHAVEVEGLQMAWVEAGDPRADECFLLLHGEPTWSYLYRHMIPVLAGCGRVVAPDLIGFGRSDKPTLPQAYTIRSQARWLRRFIEALDLKGVTLVCQDWGGLLGLRVLAREPQRFRRVIPMNTGLPDGTEPPSAAFLEWRRFSQRASSLDVAAVIKATVRRPGFTVAEAAGYAAPFPGVEHQTAVRILPRLVPIRPDHPGAWENRKAREILRALDLPALPIWGAHDPMTAPWEEQIRGIFSKAQATVRMNAGHFLQEDCGTEVAVAIRDWVRSGRTL